MSTQKTLLELVETGFKKNTTGITAATSRDGKWIKTSLEDFQHNVNHLALGLYELGIRKGDRVALHSENSTEWITIDLAILSLGAINVPIYTTQPGDQIKYILENSEAKVFFISTNKLFQSSKAFIHKLPNLMHTIGILGVFQEGMLAFEDVMAKGKVKMEAEPNLLQELKNAVQPNDLASFIYTSGTTGVPKGVMLTHYNISSNVQDSIERMPFHPDKDRGHVMLSYLPLSHIFERMITFMMLYIGYPMYYTAGIDNILEDFKTVKPLHFTSVPRLLEKVYSGMKEKANAAHGIKGKLARWAIGLAENYDTNNPTTGLAYNLADKLVFSKMRDVFGGNLVGITTGGAALPPQIMNFFNGIGIHTGQGYGLTETSPVISVYEPFNLRVGSSGKPIAHVQVRLEPVEGYDPNVEGEIVVKGPNIMQGYYKMPEATAEVLTEDGWFHTGDIGKFDNEGNIYITDRKKELLKLSTGKYVAPSPIEDTLALSVFIEQAVVIGNHCKFCSALIVPNKESITNYLAREGNKLPENWVADSTIHGLIQKAIDTANKGLPQWEQVKKFYLLETPFSIEGGELTPKLSKKRRVIQEKYQAEIDSMYV